MSTTIVNLKFPDQLEKFIGQVRQIEMSGSTVLDVIDHLDEHHGAVRDRLLEPGPGAAAAVRPYINIFLGKTNIERLDGLNTRVYPGDRVSVLLSRAGG